MLEADLALDDPASFDYADWWIRLGGFRSANDFDDNGWLPLHHAVDSMTFSQNAFYATLGLIRLTRPENINAKTTGSQPHGYTPLHMACDGSDVALSKVEVVKSLLDAHADIEAVDSQRNTPFLLAAPSGLMDVCELLHDRGANINATQIRGMGAWEKASGSSTSVAAWLLSIGAIKTHTTEARRTRGAHVSQSRAFRYASTVSSSSPYSKGGGGKGKMRLSQNNGNGKGSMDKRQDNTWRGVRGW